MVLRNRLGNLSKRWHTDVTAANRIAWASFAASHPRTDVFGESRVLSALAMYQAINGISLSAGGTYIDTPPVDIDVLALTSMSATFTAAPLSCLITFAATPLGAGIRLYVWATPPLPVGRVFMGSSLRFLGVSAAAAAADFDAKDLYVARFGAAPQVGQKIGLLVATVDPSKGAISVGLTDTIIMAAA
jgi:hypothetical protein